MFAFAGAAFRLFTGPREAVIDLASDEHSLPTAAVFATVCAALTGGIVYAQGGGRGTAIALAVAVAVAPWIYGIAYYLLLRLLLGSVTITPAAGIRFSAALTLLFPPTQLLTFGALRIGSGTTIFVSGVLPLLAIIAYSALGASAAFETERDPTWVVFTVFAVGAFCWGTCGTVAGRDRYDENGKLMIAKIEIPTPAPVREPLPEPGAPPDAGEIAESWSVRVVSIPPGATVIVDGAARGRAPVEVQVPGSKERIEVRLMLGGNEKVVTATKEQLEVIVSMPSPPTLHFDAPYHGVRGKQHQWFRFSMSGQVVAVESAHDMPAKKVAASLDRSNLTGTYRFNRDRLIFAVSSTNDSRESYLGTVGEDCLRLSTKGDDKPVEYRLMKR